MTISSAIHLAAPATSPAVEGTYLLLKKVNSIKMVQVWPLILIFELIIRNYTRGQFCHWIMVSPFLALNWGGILFYSHLWLLRLRDWFGWLVLVLDWGKLDFFFGGNRWWSVWDWAKMITCQVINWLYFFMELFNFDVLRIVQFSNCLVIKDENVQR